VVEQQAPVRETVLARPGSDVFISYSRRDRAVVERLAQALEARGRTAWVDWADIPPTAEWMQEIRSAIDAADTVVAILSPDSARSPVCGEELDAAVSANKRIVPVVVREVAAAEVPPELSKRNWLFLRETDDFEADVNTLVETLDTDLEATRFHTGLLVKAREWEQAGEPKSRLLRGSDLSGAESYVASPGKGPSATQEQTSFVLASRKAATRRQRGAIAITTVVALVAATLGVFAWNQRSAAIEQRDLAEQQTRIARSQALAGDALAAMDDQVDLAALLSIEAHRVAPTSQSTTALNVAAQTTTWVERTMRGHTEPVFALAFDPAAAMLASGSLDGTVVLWNPETGERIGAPLEGHKVVQTLAFSPDGTVLASGGDKFVILWDPRSGEQLGESIELDHSTFGLAFSPDDRTLAVGSGSTVWLIDTASAKLIKRPLDTHSEVWDIAFAPDGKTLASSGADGTVRRWDISSSKPIGLPLQGGGSIMSKVTFSPDGRTLAAGDASGRVRLWDMSTGRLIGKPLAAGGGITGLEFSSDGSLLATGGGDGGVRVWDVHSRVAIGGHLQGQQGPTDALAFSPDGRMLASGSDSGNVVIWGPIAVHRSGQVYSVFGVAFSPDGSTLATGNGDGSVNLWDPETREPAGDPLVYRGSYVNQLAFRPDGGVLAVGYGDGTVLLWNPTTGERIGPRLRGHRKGEVTLAFNPDGSILATGSWDRDVLLFNTTTWRQVGGALTGHTGRIQRVAFSPDGGMLASSAKDGTVILWDPETRRRIGSGITLSHPGDVAGLAFSPDGRVLATGFTDGSVTLWDPQTDERIGEPLTGQSGQITSLAYSPDGRVLASGAIDGNLVLWDRKTGEPIGNPLPGYGAVWGLGFSPDTELLASGGYDGSTYLRDRTAWSSDFAFLRARLCDVAGRNLTAAEWKRFLPFDPYAPTCPQWPVPPGT